MQWLGTKIAISPRHVYLILKIKYCTAVEIYKWISSSCTEKEVSRKETEDGCLWVVTLGDSFHSTSCISKVVYKEALNIFDLKLFIFYLIKKNVQHC